MLGTLDVKELRKFFFVHLLLLLNASYVEEIEGCTILGYFNFSTSMYGIELKVRPKTASEQRKP